MPEPGSPVALSKFDGGVIAPATGKLVSVEALAVKVELDGVTYSFRRLPGSKCGWGSGPAKNWRLDASSRKELCEADMSYKK
jgi:hypothetical protein